MIEDDKYEMVGVTPKGELSVKIRFKMVDKDDYGGLSIKQSKED